MAAPILYREFDGEDGLQLRSGVLSAHRHGQEIARATISDAADLEQLLRTYQVIELLPDLVFCHTSPAWYELSVNYSYGYKQSREIHGYIVFAGARYPWWVTRRRHEDFLLPNQELGGMRPWVAGEDAGMGLEFAVPEEIVSYPDPVVARRIALALECFIFNLRDGWPMDLPYRKSITNLFSSRERAWAVNLPRLVSMSEAARLSFVF